MKRSEVAERVSPSIKRNILKQRLKLLKKIMASVSDEKVLRKKFTKVVKKKKEKNYKYSGDT